MGRFAFVFLVAGLAIGLWLGFNPTTHRDLVRWWDRETSHRASASSPSLAADVRRLNSRVNRVLRSSRKPQPAPTSEPSAIPSSSQIQAELQTFWNALRQLWLNFLAKLHISTS